MFVTEADEQLLLELLNTTPVIDGVQRDDLEEEADGRAWLRARGGTGSRAELDQVRSVRDTLQRVVRDGASPTTLAPFLDSVRYRPTAEQDGLSWTLETAPHERVAATLALAWDHLRHAAPGRLRPCANDECRLYLIDRSKTNSARWCSMAVCGNRMKARRHYQRRQQAGH